MCQSATEPQPPQSPRSHRAKPQSISPPARPAGLTKDRATRYARDVVAGKIIAGPHVRAACRRHLNDLETAHQRGYRYNPARAAFVIGFCEDLLKLNGGEFEGQPFIPNGWQSFVLGSLFGWLDATGRRRFRVAYIETGKGSGKSPLAAAIGLYCLMADGEQRAEIYAAATKKDQAQILFRDAIAMVDQSPDISPLLVRSGAKNREWNLAYHATASFFRPISSDMGQSGPRPHLALVDELHEHPDDNVVEMLRAGFKSRAQPLLVAITNSGVGQNSVCWNYHQYGAEVAAGSRKDDTFFSYICGLDKGDDPFKSEKCWPKANPSLYKGKRGQPDGIPGYEFLRGQVREARGIPSKQARVKRLHFCQWTDAVTPWIDYEMWAACSPEDGYDESLLDGRRCWAGLDLSSTTDLTACVYLFEPTVEDFNWRILPRFWVPADGLLDKAERDRVPYDLWKSQGWIATTPGKAIDKRAVLRQLEEDRARFDVQAIAYDRWRMADLKSLADGDGVALPPLVDFGQGYKDMAPAVEAFETQLLQGIVRHNGNPCLTWCAANAVTVEDDPGNRKPSKRRANGRIDGIVAAIMAVGIAQKQTDQPPEPGFLFA